MDPAKVWKMVDDTFGGKATFMGQTPKRGSDVSAPATPDHQDVDATITRKTVRIPTEAANALKNPDMLAKAKAYLKANGQLDSDANVKAVLSNPAHLEAIKAFKGGE
jgi:hypothetical protein